VLASSSIREGARIIGGCEEICHWVDGNPTIRAPEQCTSPDLVSAGARFFRSGATPFLKWSTQTRPRSRSPPTPRPRILRSQKFLHPPLITARIEFSAWYDFSSKNAVRLKASTTVSPGCGRPMTSMAHVSSIGKQPGGHLLECNGCGHIQLQSGSSRTVPV
jgi:hypothetical protein